MKITLPMTALAAILGLALAGAPVSLQAQTSTTAATPSTAATTAKPAKTRFGGVLSAVDTTGNTITITDKTKGDRTFTITPTTKIQKDKKPATLADFKVGDKVGGSYTTDATGTLTATTLNAKTVTVPSVTAPTVSTPSVTAPSVTAPSVH